MNARTTSLAPVALAACATIAQLADAGFAGFVAFSRNVGQGTVIDVFAAVENPSDRFMTAGAFSDGAYGGEYYASSNTNGDPNFTGTLWNATPTTRSGVGTSAGAQCGIWCAHLVVSGNNKVIGVDFTFSAFASIKDGVTGATSQAGSSFPVPAPGACALLFIAGGARSRRRGNPMIGTSFE